MPEILMSSTMRRIEYVDRSLLSRQEQLDMDLFRFSYYTGGMSIRDMADLTADRIEGDLLNCEAADCPKVARVRLSAEAMEIMNDIRPILSATTFCLFSRRSTIHPPNGKVV